MTVNRSDFQRRFKAEPDSGDRFIGQDTDDGSSDPFVTDLAGMAGGLAPLIAVDTELSSRFASLPATSGNTVGVIGDSIMGGTDAPWIDWLGALSGGRFRVVAYGGVSGNTSTQMLARFQTDIVAKAPKWCFIGGITPNDAGNAISVATTLSNVMAMVAAARNAGIRPVVALGCPNDTTATRDHVLQANANMIQWCHANDVPMLDLYTPLADTDGTFVSANTSDGTHLSGTGARAVADYLKTRLPAGMMDSPVLAVGTDTTNLVTNGLFLTDSNADGVSDSWSTTGTATFSRTAVSAGEGAGQWQIIDIPSTTDAQIYQDVSVVAGRTYEFACRFATSGARIRIRLNGLADPLGDRKAVGDVATSAGAVCVLRWVAAATGSQRILIAAGGAIGSVRVAQVTVRDLTAIAAYG